MSPIERNADAAPAAAEERYELALQSLSVGVWDWNLAEKRLDWSPKYKQMLGIADPRFQPEPRDFERRVHPDDLEGVRLAVQRHIRQGATFDIECRLLHDDGHYIWARLSGMAQRNADGHAHRMVGSIDDISVRKEAEQKLFEREARLRDMVQHAVDGMITINTAGIVQSYNPACERIFGYATSEVVGRNISMLMPEPYHSRHDGYIRNYLSTGHAQIIGIGREVEGRRKDGSTFPMELSVSEFHSGGEVLFSGVVRDITQRKEIERMKSEFISVVSHELRTPLTSIRGALGLLVSDRRNELPPDATDLLDIAHRNSERLVLIINDILDFEKLDSGAVRLTVRPVQLATLLGECVKANEAYAARYGVTITLWIERDLPPVLADPDRLTQVMANLLSNAAKFTRANTSVAVRAESSGGMIRISVQDRGQGIPEEMRKTIFERFAQADHSNSRERTGTGLGLSIARHLVQLMNGRIDVSSEPGKGATFFVDMPVASDTRARPHARRATDRVQLLKTEAER